MRDSQEEPVKEAVVASEEGFSETLADIIISTVKREKRIKLSKLAKTLREDVKNVEAQVKTLQAHGVVELQYPSNIFAGPTVVLADQTSEKRQETELPEDKKLLEGYDVTNDSVTAKINIWSSPSRDLPVYELTMPHLGIGTQAMINALASRLAQEVPIEIEDITDPRKIIELKQKFFRQAEDDIKNRLPKIGEDRAKMLAGILLHCMYGLGETEMILADNWLEEIAINSSKEPILVYHKKHGWLETTKYLRSEEEIYNFAAQIGRKVGRDITSLHPIMDAHLLTGDRVAATLFPISTFGNTITIRRFARNPWTIIHLIDPEVNCLSKEMAAFLWMAIQYELNILVAGGTAAGKTSVLNAVCSVIPATQRIISIEDTRELTLPQALQKNWVPLTTRNPNPEGMGAISMLDLMVASLRMRPDRLIVGEVRRRQQAEAMFEAMHTGHSVYCTMHADTVAQVQRRLVEPPIRIPQSEVEALHLILVQYRDRRKGIRRTLELAEVLSSGETLDVNYLYRWRPRTDTFEKANDSIRIVEELNLHTGMTVSEIKKDLKEKQAILQWMLDNSIKDVDKVGQVMRSYYKNPDVVLDAVRNKKKAGSIIK
ncbi:MAG: type II/IV secretion system ATPase subunit [Nanoarchaeota archaeon]|nr:type II/IV secretion system ATPase subunit [Nanoarchaeota archaeon]